MADESEDQTDKRQQDTDQGISAQDLIPDEDEDDGRRKGIKEIRRSLDRIEDDLEEILGEEDEDDEGFDHGV